MDKSPVRRALLVNELVGERLLDVSLCGWLPASELFDWFSLVRVSSSDCWGAGWGCCWGGAGGRALLVGAMGGLSLRGTGGLPLSEFGFSGGLLPTGGRVDNGILLVVLVKLVIGLCEFAFDVGASDSQTVILISGIVFLSFWWAVFNGCASSFLISFGGNVVDCLEASAWLPVVESLAAAAAAAAFFDRLVESFFSLAACFLFSRFTSSCSSASSHKHSR